VGRERSRFHMWPRRVGSWSGGFSTSGVAFRRACGWYWSPRVSSGSVRHSLNWCEGRLPKAEVTAAHATRLRLRAFKQLAEKYVDELESLMTDPNPFVRLKALEAFRRTTGLETPGGVNVSVNQQTAVVSGTGNGDRPQSFEAMLTRVRATIFAPNDVPNGTDCNAVQTSDAIEG